MKEIEKLLRTGIPAEELIKEIEEAKARIELEKNSTKAKENIKSKLEENLIAYLSIGKLEPLPKKVIDIVTTEFNSYLASLSDYCTELTEIHNKKKEISKDKNSNKIDEIDELLDWIAKNFK